MNTDQSTVIISPIIHPIALLLSSLFSYLYWVGKLFIISLCFVATIFPTQIQAEETQDYGKVRFIYWASINAPKVNFQVNQIEFALSAKEVSPYIPLPVGTYEITMADKNYWISITRDDHLQGLVTFDEVNGEYSIKSSIRQNYIQDSLTPQKAHLSLFNFNTSTTIDLITMDEEIPVIRSVAPSSYSTRSVIPINIELGIVSWRRPTPVAIDINQFRASKYYSIFSFEGNSVLSTIDRQWKPE